MKLIIFSLIASFLFFFHLYSFAQGGKGYLMIAVRPENAIIRLDTTLVIQKQIHQVIDPGTYIIRAWAPGRKLIVDTLIIGEGQGILFRRKLQTTDEYTRYKTQKLLYNTTRILPGAITLGVQYFIMYLQKNIKPTQINFFVMQILIKQRMKR